MTLLVTGDDKTLLVLMVLEIGDDEILLGMGRGLGESEDKTLLVLHYSYNERDKVSDVRRHWEALVAAMSSVE